MICPPSASWTHRPDHDLPSPPSTTAKLTVDHSAAVPDARRFATTHAHHLGLGEDRLTDLELAVTELVTNSIDHSGGTLRIWSDHDQLISEVTDSRQLTDPLAGRRPPTQPRGGAAYSWSTTSSTWSVTTLSRPAMGSESGPRHAPVVPTVTPPGWCCREHDTHGLRSGEDRRRRGNLPTRK
jgi:hypothetical protein